MKLPLNKFSIKTEWQEKEWHALQKKAALFNAARKSNAFEEMLKKLRDMALSGRFNGLLELLKRRITARALTWLWLNDEHISDRLLKPELLNALIIAQSPRLTRISLLQLVQLYFRKFDLLNKKNAGMLEQIEKVLCQQLPLLSEPKVTEKLIDPLMVLKREGSWLLNVNGPTQLIRRVRDRGAELESTLEDMGLHWVSDGRYADICRTLFYLETLRQLQPGEDNPVLGELLKSDRAKVLYQGNHRIGHVALEILIDRVEQDPGEIWLNFILALAGDPRISRSVQSYREWWLPLGEDRIQKVCGWLSKEDLSLFLQAMEQFGIQDENRELQRMFPARKRFLEGLFKLKLVRQSRLFLGKRANNAIVKIINKEVKTSFASLDNSMSDKAIIYLDCGKFYLIEGSHSFRIWIYLAAPSKDLIFYEKSCFTHADLTVGVPSVYKKNYPELPFEAVTHNPLTWQKKVFVFLAKNGISLDIEQLLDNGDYQDYLKKYGLPVVDM